MTHPHRFDLRVYYEDTDLAGIVYYANYFKFIERARSEWVRALGIDQLALKDQDGVVFAVRSLTADYISPAKFDDQLCVETTVITSSPARLVLAQDVLRNDQPLFRSQVTLVAIGPNGAPTRLPRIMRDKLPT